ncbi:MAG: 2-phospho-L-lactate guanylyltransferase [Thermoleophilaceae bacterium]
MRTLAILPIKSFDAAKQRLSGVLGSGSRQALAQAMFSDVLAALRHVPGLEAVAVVTSDDKAEAAAALERVHVIADSAHAGHSAAAMLGIRHALAIGYERVLLVPGDAPLLDAAELAGLLERSAAADVAVAIVPDRHGTGTNGLLIAPPGCFEPSFGPGSRERHVEAARAAGLSHVVEPLPSLVHDIDTPDDLAELAAVLESRRGSAPSTRGALAQLQRCRIAVGA